MPTGRVGVWAWATPLFATPREGAVVWPPVQASSVQSSGSLAPHCPKKENVVGSVAVWRAACQAWADAINAKPWAPQQGGSTVDVNGCPTLLLSDGKRLPPHPMPPFAPVYHLTQQNRAAAGQ